MSDYAGNPLPGREVLLEFIALGPYVKVTALDVATSVEASIQGPKNAPELMLKNNAMRRLAYVLRKGGYIE